MHIIHKRRPQQWSQQRGWGRGKGNCERPQASILSFVIPVCFAYVLSGWCI